MEKAAIRQNGTTSSLVALSPEAVSVVIRPFIPLCTTTHQEKPSISALSFTSGSVLAHHVFKALVPTVTRTPTLLLVPKEMGPSVQAELGTHGLLLIQSKVGVSKMSPYKLHQHKPWRGRRPSSSRKG